MNYAIVFRLLGYVLMIEGALLLLPAAASLVYGEWMVLGVFLLTAAVSAGIGYALHTIKPRSKVFYMREGFAATSLCWVFISVMGAVPFVLTGCIPNPVDALFETVSGFTTTGASILPGVEDLPKGILFWRSFTHWIGGMGVLVFLLSLLPLTGGSHVNLMKAESPGPSVGKLVPKVRQTAKYLYIIYFALTMIEVIFLLFGGMNLFEALTTSFGTAGTGGFAIWNDGFVSVSPYNQWVVTIFMLLFGVNFGFYFLILTGKLRDALKFEEVRIYFIIVIAAAVFIFINLRHFALYAPAEGIRQAFFQVASIITTTGFATADYLLWPPLLGLILFLLLFVGASAGSTAGGMKVVRVYLLFKNSFVELKRIIHPNGIINVKYNNKSVHPNIMTGIMAFAILFMIVFTIGSLIMTIFTEDIITACSAVVSSMSNVGPGFGSVGPMFSYAHLNDFAKLFLAFLMLVGRLEIFTVMVLFTKAFWRK